MATHTSLVTAAKLPANSSDISTPANGLLPPADGPLPRPGKRRRRDRVDRGLPPDSELRRLAAKYLETQRKHWLKLAEAGVLPETTDAVLAAMVEDFKRRHRTGEIAPERRSILVTIRETLAGSYNRFSCDNSDPNSIIDQLVNALDKAKAETRFIPWDYVFGDYSVSGLDPSRQGYQSYKAVLADDSNRLETTYIDDFTRASRDELEWWKLAALSKRLQKRMIGASDGFDLNSPDWDTKITLFGLVSRLFIKSLREKVKRGMKGTAGRGTCLGKLPLGFTKQIHRDQHGQIVYRQNGTPRYEPCIDPVTRANVEMMFDLYTRHNWSPYRIARHFNQLQVDNWEGHTDNSIRDLLYNSAFIGIFIWNRTHREFDWEKEKWVVVPNPRSEWVIHIDPKLAIIGKEQWKAARRKLGNARRNNKTTGRTPSRNEKCATTLFSGTLFCEYCGRELTLLRSSKKYKNLYCQHGSHGIHGCKLSASKSTRIVEEALLRQLRDTVLTDEAIEDLVDRTNRAILEESKRPRIDTRPLKAKSGQLAEKIKRLFRRIEDETDDRICRVHRDRIVQLRSERDELMSEIAKAESQNARPTKPLDLERVKQHLADFRGVLNDDIPMAAEAIRTLTGPITISQETVPGRKRGAEWVATFQPHLAQALAAAGKKKTKSDSDALLFMSRHESSSSATVKVRIAPVPKYEQIAVQAREMNDKGASPETIARALETSRETVRQALDFSASGRRPPIRPQGKKRKTGKGAAKYKAIADEVAQLRDRQEWSFPKIAKKLCVSENTVKRAYDFKHPEAIVAAAKDGTTPTRGCWSHLGREKKDKIRQLLGKGKSPKEIAIAVGCSENSVRREASKVPTVKSRANRAG